MPERDGYIPGVPCWVDTSQPDPEAAVDFYRGLFGWDFEDVTPPILGDRRRVEQILADRKTMAVLDGIFHFEPVGELTLKGFSHPVPGFALKDRGRSSDNERTNSGT